MVLRCTYKLEATLTSGTFGVAYSGEVLSRTPDTTKQTSLKVKIFLCKF